MNTLYLYIDQYFIVGAKQDADGEVVLLNSGDRLDADRFWLYFYQKDDRLYYSKAYESHYRNNEANYHGDVLRKMIDCESVIHYKNYAQPLRAIFYNSGLIENIRKAAGFGDEEVTTFLAFSSDINRYACQMFKEELEKYNFRVVSCAYTLEQLAACSIQATCKSLGDKFVLMSALDQNLHICFYEKSGKQYRMKQHEDVLKDRGRNFFRQSILDYVLDLCEQNKRLPSEFRTRETGYLRDKADEWLTALYSADMRAELHFSFEHAPQNPIRLFVEKNEFEDVKLRHTIIDEMRRCINNAEGDVDTISTFVCIGEIFDDNFVSIIAKELSAQHPINPMVYNTLKAVGEFLLLYKRLIGTEEEKMWGRKFKTDAEDAKKVQEKLEAQREEERLNEDPTIRRDIENEAERRERDYRYAMAFAKEILERPESTRDYSLALDVLKVALEKKPGDEEAMHLQKDTEPKKLQQEFNNRMYENMQETARNHYERKEWNLALSAYQQLQSIRTGDLFVRKRIQQINEKLETLSRIKDFCIDAEKYEACGMLEKAADQLKQALCLDADNADVLERLDKVEEKRRQQRVEIPRLKDTLFKAMRERNWHAAQYALRELQALSPNEEDVDYLDCEEKIEDGLEEYKRIERERGKLQAEYDEWMEKGKSANMQRDYSEAVKHFERALKVFPDDEKARKMLDKAKDNLSESAKPTKRMVQASTGRPTVSHQQPDSDVFIPTQPKTYSEKEILELGEKDRFAAMRKAKDLFDRGDLTREQFEAIKKKVNKR